MVLNALSTAVQYTAHAGTLFCDAAIASDGVEKLVKRKECDNNDKVALVVAATSTVATVVLPLVALCLRKAAPHHAKRVYLTAQVLRVGAAAGRAWLYSGVNAAGAAAGAIGELASVALQEIALQKQRHLLAGLGAAGRLGARAVLFA